jgi:ribosomal protein L37AE/L43A
MNMLRRLMYGRYGSDQLSLFLLVVYLLLYLISMVLKWPILSWIALVILFWDFYRMMSRRIDKRRAENAKFLQLAGPAIRWFKMRRTIHRDRDHRYFKCPNCGQYLRVPRGKGKITINCRNCGVSFEERS